MSKIPDAKGTATFLEVLKCIVDSYLDKKLDPLSRIEILWYAVFFMRYWRKWLTLHPDFTLANNFITRNAYMCIELNVHALITFLITLRDTPSADKCFMPWFLGSQSCEKIIRAGRSMSSTFSTMINFGMLGFLRRLHRMQIQLSLEAESDTTVIKYLRSERHKNKDGHQQQLTIYSISDLSNDKIAGAVEKGKERAKQAIIILGMDELLQKEKNWEMPPIPMSQHVDVSDKNDDDNVDELPNEIPPEILEQANLCNDNAEIASDISDLHCASIIQRDMHDHLMSMHRSSFRRLSESPLPMFEAKQLPSTKQSHDAKKRNKKFCPYVEILHKGKTVYINKTTAVWLLQEGERVSSYRLFWVRNMQPFSAEAHLQKHSIISKVPILCNKVEIGDICTFVSETVWDTGRVVQFAYYREKTKKALQYHGNSVDLSKGEVRVLCTWFDKITPQQLSLLSITKTHHSYIPLQLYICTFTQGCFQSIQSDAQGSASLMNVDLARVDLATAEILTLTACALCFIENEFK